MNKLVYFVKNPKRFLEVVLNHISPLIHNDELYIKMMWKLKMDYPLNLDCPKTYNEKLQWLKLYDRRPEYTAMVDKYAVKKYVADIIGEEYIIPTLGVWDKPEDIEWEKLPNKFVLKCTHDSGGLVICQDKKTLDKNAAIKKLRKSLKRDYYLAGREWPYKNVPRRIIAEQYLEDSKGELNDYKVFNFDGEPRIIEVDYNRFKGHLRNLYTEDWERINATIGYPTDLDKDFDKPDILSEMKELCRKLSFGIPHLRSDFYVVDNKIYFGELTFFHGSGMEQFSQSSLEKQLGDWIVQPVDNGGGKICLLCKNNTRMIIRLKPEQVADLPDYKFFCFNGVVKAMFVATERQNPNEDVKFDFFDADFKHLPFVQGHENAKITPQKPLGLDVMKKAAEKLSKGLPQLRVDFYELNGKIYFGELTLFHFGGMVPFVPARWDNLWGDMLTLPQKRQE